MDFFDKIALKIKKGVSTAWHRLRAYFRRLFFPIYLFPLKLITYSSYYTIKFIFLTILALFSLVLDMIIYPFRGLKQFIKSVFYLLITAYLFLTFLVVINYMWHQYGNYVNFFCSFDTQMIKKLRQNTVRIVGGYSEGSGFFIADDQVITNFHVIADEPSPKVILSDGKFLVPIKIVGSKEADLAVITVSELHPELVMPLPDDRIFDNDQVLFSSGYAMGTDIKGEATVVRGRLVDFRVSRRYTVPYIQTDINLVEGMSGGPLVDQCSNVKGINTMGLSGLSFFIEAKTAKDIIPTMTDAQIAKIKVDPSKSPQDAVIAFYTYLKARRMQDGFNLLSSAYLQKTNFDEWTSRFKDVLDVDIILSERYQNSQDTAFVKFRTKNWVDGEVENHYYEGTWKTIKEDGVYKMLKSNIKEVQNPGWEWYY